MFDIGFSELLVIALVALVVLGPERLPKAARLAGMWMRRARMQWQAVKSELENELADEDMRRSIGRAREELREAQEALRADGARLRAQLADVEARMAEAPAAAVAIDAPLQAPAYADSDPSSLRPRAAAGAGDASEPRGAGPSATSIAAPATGAPVNLDSTPADAIDAPATPSPTHDMRRPVDSMDGLVAEQPPAMDAAPLHATNAPTPQRDMFDAELSRAEGAAPAEPMPARAPAAPPHAGRDGQR